MIPSLNNWKDLVHIFKQLNITDPAFKVLWFRRLHFQVLKPGIIKIKFSFVLFSLLSEVLSPKDQAIKASVQAWRYFYTDSQALTQPMLQQAIWRWWQEISAVPQPRLPKFLPKGLSWSQVKPYAQELPSFLLAR